MPVSKVPLCDLYVLLRCCEYLFYYGCPSCLYATVRKKFYVFVDIVVTCRLIQILYNENCFTCANSLVGL